MVITVPPSTQPRAQRPCLVSVGLPGKLPLTQSGLVADMETLVDAAWMALGAHVTTAVLVHVEADSATRDTLATQEVATSGDASTTAGNPLPPPVTQTNRPHTPVTRPKQSNLSLF